jgi:histone H3/H4
MKSEELILQELERDRHKQTDEEGLQAAAERASNSKFMISGEAPVLMGKACELMIKELTVRAWHHTERNKRKTLQRQDLHAAVGESETYDFLIDFLPRLPASAAIPQMLTNPATTVAGLPQGIPPAGYFAQTGLPQTMPLPGFNFVDGGVTAGEAAQFAQQTQDPTALAFHQQMQQQQQQLQQQQLQQQQLQQQQVQQLQQQQQQQQQQHQLQHQHLQQQQFQQQHVQQQHVQQQHVQQQHVQQQHVQQQQVQQQQVQQQQVHQPQHEQLHHQHLAHETDISVLASGDTQAQALVEHNDPLWAFESSDGSINLNDPSSGV